MIQLFAVVILPVLVHELGAQGYPAGWLLWVISYPLLIWHCQRLSPRIALYFTPVLLALSIYHPTNSLRYFVQIVLPSILAGVLLRRHELRLRDTLWLSSLSLMGSIAVGFGFGMKDRLREVIIPAGFPTGWTLPFVSQWDQWLRAFSPNTLVYSRFLSFAEHIEPVLWSSLLFAFTAAGVGIALYLWDPQALKKNEYRDRIFDIVLSIFTLSLALSLLTTGSVAIIASEIAFVMIVFFLLEGIQLLFRFYTHLKVRRWISWCSLIVLIREPLFLFLLPLLGFVSGFSQLREEGELR